MFARFNLKTNRGFDESIYLYPEEQMNYLVEYSADLNDWDILDIQESEMVLNYYIIGKKIYKDIKKYTKI